MLKQVLLEKGLALKLCHTYKCIPTTKLYFSYIASSFVPLSFHILTFSPPRSPCFNKRLLSSKITCDWFLFILTSLEPLHSFMGCSFLIKNVRVSHHDWFLVMLSSFESLRSYIHGCIFTSQYINSSHDRDPK